MKTIFYFKGLAQRAFLGTCTHCTWADAFGITSVYVLASNITGNSFLKKQENLKLMVD